jgi:hypothetical protein
LNEVDATGCRFLTTLSEARSSPRQVIVTTHFTDHRRNREAIAGTPENKKTSREQSIPTAFSALSAPSGMRGTGVAPVLAEAYP